MQKNLRECVHHVITVFENKVTIQLASAVYFLATGNWKAVSVYLLCILRDFIQFLSLCSCVDCGFKVRVSSRVRVSVTFIFLAFFDSNVG